MPDFTSTGTEYIDEFFAHHGIKGQKWGIRRWQNLDSSLTEAGRKRYAKAKERWSDEGVVHSDEGGYLAFADICSLMEDDTLTHSGILGMKWGLRRFQNPDGSLTEAGRKRYAKSLGGAKTISEKEKEQAKKAKWASDPKSLYKHRDEFTKDEIDKAMEVFSSQNKLKQQIEADKESERRAKEARRKAKADYKKAKLDYKRLQLQEKLDKTQAEERYKQQKLDKTQAEERYKQQKLETEQKKMANKQKQDTAEASTKADIWRSRASKLQSVLSYAKEGKKILDDMGITGGESGESLFGALAESMGLKDTSVAKAKKQAKEQREKDKADLEFRKLAAQVKSAEIGAKQAEYNLNNPAKGGKGVDTDKLAQDIIDKLRDQGVL